MVHKTGEKRKDDGDDDECTGKKHKRNNGEHTGKAGYKNCKGSDKRTHYPATLKRKVLERVEELKANKHAGAQAKAADEFQIAVATVHNWVKNEAKIKKDATDAQATFSCYYMFDAVPNGI